MRHWRLSLRLVVLAALCTTLMVVPAAAQTGAGPWTVFLAQTDAATRLIFVDALTGAETTTVVNGERFTPLPDAIMYYDPVRGRVMLAGPDGVLREHPFIQPNLETRRVDWVVSGDGTRIAWTLTNTDSIGQLLTVTRIANLDGTEAREVLVDGPRADGRRALPLAFSPDNRFLYMDAHPDGLSDFMPLVQYADLFMLDTQTGELQPMPGETEQFCFCGADWGDELFLRLTLSPDQQGFDLHIHNLEAGVEEIIPALDLRNYTQSGDLLLSENGTRAVYALVQIIDFGTAQQSTRTVFALVDLGAMTQEPLTATPIQLLVRPVAWTEEDSAILFTSPTRSGTWKITLAERRLERVAEATYIGVVGP